MNQSKSNSAPDDTPKNQKPSKTKNAPGSPRIEKPGGDGTQTPPETESGQDAGEILEETATPAAASATEPVNRLADSAGPADTTPPTAAEPVNRLAGGTGPADAESTAGTGEILEKSETPAASAAVRERSLGEVFKAKGELLMALEKKIKDGTATAWNIKFYEIAKKQERRRRRLDEDYIYENFEDLAGRKLTKPERDILEALGDDKMTGEKLLGKAGYTADSGTYKKTLSEMVKRGILRNDDDNQGYYRGEIQVYNKDGKTYYYKKISS